MLHRPQDQGVRRWAADLALAVAVSFATLVGHAINDEVRVENAADLEQVTFGGPVDWLAQDQSALDPPFPHEAELRWPWEHPVTVEVLPLLADLALLVSVVLLAWFAGGAWRKQREQRAGSSG